MRLTVINDDKTVVLNGVAHVCESWELPGGIGPDFHAIQLDNGVGSVEYLHETTYIQDPAVGAIVAQPFVAAWTVAGKKAAEAADAKKKAEADELAKEEAADAAQRERWRPIREARMTLEGTDHEIIKAYERELAEKKLLPPEFVKARESARQVLREFKKTGEPPK